MKVALVYDRVNKWGGAERVLLSLHNIWPSAPLFTAVYDKMRARWASVFRIKPSFLQYLPFAPKNHEVYPWLTPLAFESFCFDDYDLVISVTSAEAKNIITKPGKTLHICYCLTPTRYLWSGYQDYLDRPGLGRLNYLAGRVQRIFTPTLRRWDNIASARPDYYLAISQLVADRIGEYYQRKVAEIIYPPVDTDQFKIKSAKTGNSYLVVSRLVGYKRVDIIIDAFNDLGWPLVVIGSGRQKEELQNKAKGNIKFIDHYLTQKQLVNYYQNCRALVHAAAEDFGIVAVEAQAAGKPVISFEHSGMKEAIVDGKTGIFFTSQTSEALKATLVRFAKMNFDSRECQKQAQKFDQKIFERKFQQTVETIYNKHYGNIVSS